jgi:predicted nucleic acid-binding protein
MIFIDTNIWCFYFDKRLPEHNQVREPLRQVLLSTEEVVCSTIVIMEIAHYLVRHFEEKAAKRKIEIFTSLRNLRIVAFDNNLTAESLENLLTYGYSEGLGGRDSTIMAAMKVHGISRIMTHDKVFKRLSSKMPLDVIDPINE